MTIQQLGYFIRLAEELNYTYVARVFFITQPTLSRQIVNLENELNVTLFVREHNTVRLTREGRHFYDRIKPIYQDLVRTIEETQNISGTSATLMIGIQEEQLISSSLMQAVTQLREKHPNLQVSILRGNTASLFEGLNSGKFDLLNMLCYPQEEYSDDNLVFYQTQSESTYMVIAKGMEDSLGNEMTKEEFQNYVEKYPVILPELFENYPSEKPRQFLTNILEMRDSEQIRILKAGTPISLPVQVASRLGISISNKTNMFSIDPDIKMVRIQGTEHTYLKGLFYPRSIAKPCVKELIRLTKKETEKYQYQ